LDVIEPAHIEATLAALDQLDQQRLAGDQLWQQRLERAQYEAERAGRQYNRVEPENRLVARELETQWNTALQNLEDMKRAYTQAQAQLLAPLSVLERDQIQHLVEDLPRVWEAPSTTAADRKRMLRCLIRDVSLDGVSQAGQTRIHIRWQTEAITALQVKRPTSADAHRLPAATVCRIRQLAQTHPDHQVAEILNQQGLKTQHGLDWSYRRVKDTRLRHQIPSACPILPQNGQPRGDGLISAKQAAQQLHTCPNSILLWAQKGILYNEQKAGVCPVWVRLTPEDLDRLTLLVPPPESVRVRQACRELQISHHQFWDRVRNGQYTIYRVLERNHWEFRVNLPDPLQSC
jgi:hypothetical protein